MTSKLKTRDVPKSHYSNYLKRAQECLTAAQLAHGREEWNSSAINSIHAVISLADAMCVYFLGKRHSGENHNDAAGLFKSIKDDEDTNANVNRIIRVLRLKNMAEYEERLVNRPEADKMLIDAQRLDEFVKKRIKD